MKVLIITGGTSSERRISTMSSRGVKKALESLQYTVKLFDLKKGLVELKKMATKFDVIFPVLHGEEGEGGDLQKFLSTLDKPFVGGDWTGYKKGWYKISFKKFCEESKILTSPWKKVKNKNDVIKFGFPCVLKSTNGGSSREVAILKSLQDLKNALVKKLLKSKELLFVEKFLPGTEITVAVLGTETLPVIEIVAPDNGWFDYKNKYWGKVKEIPNAPSISDKLRKEAQKIALKIHQDLKLGQFSRTDFIISNERIYALEVNTIPGLTSSSLFPKAALSAGISFPDLLDKIIRLALSS